MELYTDKYGMLEITCFIKYMRVHAVALAVSRRSVIGDVRVQSRAIHVYIWTFVMDKTVLEQVFSSAYVSFTLS
jgi:hypothetical protein